MAKKERKKVVDPDAARKANAFPFLSMSLPERLTLSNNIEYINGCKIVVRDNGYWDITPL